MLFSCPPPQWGGLDLGSDNSGCARLGGSKVPSPLGVVKEKFVVVVVLVRRHRRAVGTAVRFSSFDISPNSPTTSSSRRRVLTPVGWSWWPFAQVRGLALHTWAICHGWSKTGVIPAASRKTKSRDRAAPGPHAPVSLHSRARRAWETQSEANTNRNEL